MIWHPRTDWVGAEPVTGPPIRWPDIDTVVVHYTAALNLIDGDPGENWFAVPAYLRSIQHEYLTNRHPGYSVGYNVAVDARGDVWELRGFDIKCAANKGHNDHTWAILVLVDGQSPVTEAAVAVIRELVSAVEVHAARPLAIKGHRDLDATQCPGVGVYAQITSGAFRPQITDRPRPVDPPPMSEEDEVIKLIVYVDKDSLRTGALVAIDGAGTEMIGFSSGADRDTIVGETGLTPRAVSAAQYDDFVLHALAGRK